VTPLSTTERATGRVAAPGTVGHVGRAAKDHTRRAASHYLGTSAAGYFAYQQQMGELGAKLDRPKFEKHVRPTDTVVDFGCGTGALLAALSAERKLGVDPSEPARRAAAQSGIECVPSAGDLESDIADVVISNHALEHSLCPFEELRELRRALKPGGTLVVWLPLDDWRTQRAVTPDPNHHLYAWTPLLLGNLLAEAGLEVLECRIVTHAWPPFTRTMARLPQPLFDAMARLWALARRRRQVMAVAIKHDVALDRA
jgi:SAM-dependent methyltransferase